MSGDELTFLQSLESEEKKSTPKPFVLGKGGDTVRLAFNRKLQNITSFRDWTVILVLLDTGLRASELVGLTMSDVNLDEGLLKVCGKGNKERVVPIGAKVQRAVWKYINRHRPRPANHLRPTLFLTASGRPITTDRLRTIIKKYTGRVADFTSSLIKGLQGLSQNPKMFVANMSLTWILWLTQTFAIYFTFIAFNYPLPFAAAILGGVLMSVSHILPATPGYVGSYEAFWVLIFTLLGVTQADSLLAMGVISHLVGILPIVIIGCVSVVWLGASFEEIFKFKKYVAAAKPLADQNQ